MKKAAGLSDVIFAKNRRDGTSNNALQVHRHLYFISFSGHLSVTDGIAIIRKDQMSKRSSLQGVSSISFAVRRNSLI